jgi:hypothetical protein
MAALAINLKPAVTKKDVDFLFGLKISEWQANAKKFFACDWNTTSGEFETENRVMGFHPSTGMGVSVQPMYSSDDDPPFMIIIGNYIPLGDLPPITDDTVSHINASLRHQLGSAYNVQCSYRDIDEMGILEIVLTPSTHLGASSDAALQGPSL